MPLPSNKIVYSTELGVAYRGDALPLLKKMDDESVDLVLTSPPFALTYKKEYGNEHEDDYVDWFEQFAREVKRVMKPEGSFVIDLGGAYRRGRPVRSLYNYRVLMRLCDELGFELAEEFFWHNPSKLPAPAEWVNRRRIRTKDTVNTIWWLCKSDFPKVDVRKVLVEYSEEMKILLEDPEAYYKPTKRPSGHVITSKFGNGNGGAIPSNLLSIPNTDSRSPYMENSRLLGLRSHPARFPEQLPAFFIAMLTDSGDTVLDIFAGSNTTGGAAERLGRKWLAIERDANYARQSVLRFVEDEAALEEARQLILGERKAPLRLSPSWSSSVVTEPKKPTP